MIHPPEVSVSQSEPTGFFGIRGPYRHCWNEAISVRHFDLRQTLGIKDVGLLNDTVAIEQKRDQCVNFVRGERSRFICGHSAVDIVPRDRRIWVVARSGLFGIFKRATIRIAGTAQHQTLGCPSFSIPPVADRAPLRKDLRTFLGGSASGRKFLSLRATYD